MQPLKAKQGYQFVKSSFGRYEEIPKEWELTRIDNLLKINMGQSPPSKSYNDQGIGLPFFQGVTDFGEFYPEPKIWCTDTKKTAEPNHILFSVRAPVGEINLTNVKCCIGRGVASLVPIHSDLRYCFYLLKQFKNNFIKYSQGSTYEAINLDEIGQTRFIFTRNLPEQQKIASILSNVDSLIQQTQKEIEQTQRLKKGLMQRLLTKGIGHTKFKKVKSLFGKYDEIPEEWKVTTINKLGEIVTGNTPSTENKEYYGDEFLWSTPFDISDQKYVEKTDTKLSKKGFEIARKIPANTVLFVCIGSTIGKVGMARKEMATNQQINSIICKGNDPDFVYYRLLLNSRKIKNMANQVAIPILNKTDFGTIKVSLPANLAEQQKIALILLNIDSQIQKQQEYKSKLEILKKGLMQKLLTGQIRVKV